MGKNISRGKFKSNREILKHKRNIYLSIYLFVRKVNNDQHNRIGNEKCNKMFQIIWKQVYMRRLGYQSR